MESAAAQHVVDGVVLGDVGQVDGQAVGGGHEVDGPVQGGEHPEAEQIELHQPGRRAVVLVPLEHGAVLHPGPLHRAHLDDGSVAQDHPAGVDAEMAGGVLDLGREGEHRLGDLLPRRSRLIVGALLGGGGGHRAPAVDLLAPGVGLALGVAEGLGHVPHRRAGPVGDDVGDLGGVVAAVALVDVLDDLFAAPRLDVDVDVRGPVALGGEEPLEEEPELHGVGLGDAEGEAHRRVGRRPPPLAVDVLLATELHDVPDDEEVAGEVELGDHLELMVDLDPGLGRTGRGPVAVAAFGAFLGEETEETHLVEAVGARVGRQLGGDEGQVEGAGPTQLRSPLDHTRVAGEAAGLLGPRPQVGAGGGREPAIELVEAAAGAHCSQGGGQRSLGG